MALYDLGNPLDAQNFKLRCNSLYKKGCIVELKERKPQRTQSQNRYLHTCLGYFGALTGNTLEYVKQEYYKILCNPDTFIREVDDKYRGRIKILRSSADLDTAELSLTLDRFRDWAAQEAGIYIPSPDEHRLVQLMEMEVERNRNHL